MIARPSPIGSIAPVSAILARALPVLRLSRRRILDEAGKAGRLGLYCANGCTRELLVDAVATTTGTSIVKAEREEVDAAAARCAKQERAMRLWHGAEPAPYTLADRYLIRRALPGLAASPALRFRGDTPHPEGGRLPALLALVTNAAGEPIAVHRTYLGRDGRKATIEPQKASSARYGAVPSVLDSLIPTARW